MLAAMSTRGIRGAITVARPKPESPQGAEENAILEATIALLRALQEANGFALEDIASVIFTTTDDLDAVYPARAARELGWLKVPLLGAREINMPGGLPRCIRVLIHWNTQRSQQEIHHVYLRDATRLRPDRAR